VCAWSACVLRKFTHVKYQTSLCVTFGADGIILSGKPCQCLRRRVRQRAKKPYLSFGVPVLGICYGMQTMAQQLGGKVEAGHKREFGYATSSRSAVIPLLFRDIQDSTNAEGHGLIDVWMSHGDKVTELPTGFKVIASTTQHLLLRWLTKHVNSTAVQFHLKWTHTKQGQAMLRRFVFRHLCAKPDWIMGDYIAEAVAKSKRKSVMKKSFLVCLVAWIQALQRPWSTSNRRSALLAYSLTTGRDFRLNEGTWFIGDVCRSFTRECDSAVKPTYTVMGHLAERKLPGSKT